MRNRRGSEDSPCGTAAKESARKERTRGSFLLNLRVNTVYFGKEPFAPFVLRSIPPARAPSFQLTVARALRQSVAYRVRPEDG